MGSSIIDLSPSHAPSSACLSGGYFFTQCGFRSRIKKSALDSAWIGTFFARLWSSWEIFPLTHHYSIVDITLPSVDISASGSPYSTSCSSPHVCETEWPVVDRTMTSKKWALTGGFLYRGAHRIKQRRVRIPSTSNYEQSHALYLIFVPLCSSSNHSGQRSMPSQTQARNAM